MVLDYTQCSIGLIFGYLFQFLFQDYFHDVKKIIISVFLSFIILMYYTYTITHIQYCICVSMCVCVCMCVYPFVTGELTFKEYVHCFLESYLEIYKSLKWLNKNILIWLIYFKSFAWVSWLVSFLSQDYETGIIFVTILYITK